MTTLEGATSEDVLRRADGVQLIGEMQGSGYRVPPALVRRGDGQTLQLTPLLYLTLEAVDGERTLDDVATIVSDRSGRTVTADNVRTLVDEQLRPLGVMTRPDGSEPEVKRSNPLLGLRLRYAVTDPERTRRLTNPFAFLFRPWVVVPVLLAFGVVCWWVFLEKGLASATRDAINHPGLLLLVFAVTVVSAGFHEFGHASAARYGGATPGVMGAGVYLMWPAFYTDVTDSYRLGRAGRVRTDLGGLYFNAIVAVGIAGAWALTSYDALLLVVATQILQMVRQLMPLVRFDGYHVLADVTGVPDLFHRIKPTLLGALPWRWGDPQARLLKPWARTVVTLWVAAVVPMLLFTIAMMVIALPRVLSTAWVKVRLEAAAFGVAWSHADVVTASARALVIAAVAFPVLATLLVMGRTVRRTATSVWRSTAGRPVRRLVAGCVAASVVAGLAYAWWPAPATWQPIQPGEHGTLGQGVGVLTGAARVPVAPTGYGTTGAAGRGVTTAVWDSTDPLPSEAHPQLAVVLTPANGGTDTSGKHAWVFPFDKPLGPGPGDNQALAVNTTDGTVTYDVAFALVWADPSQPATNTNEAYAFASCRSCGAVAIAFQVVLVPGNDQVVAPENLAGALTSSCANCLTYALARQLFVTLDGPLSQAATAQLDQLWARIAAFGHRIDRVPLDEVAGRLDAYEQQIIAIINADQPGTVPTASPTASPTTAPTTSPTAGPTPSPGDASGSSPSPSPSGSPTPGGSPTPSPSGTPSGATSSDASPSATAASTPAAWATG